MSTGGLFAPQFVRNRILCSFSFLTKAKTEFSKTQDNNVDNDDLVRAIYLVLFDYTLAFSVFSTIANVFKVMFS